MGILSTLFSLIIIYLLILKNRFRPYQWKTISEKIGRDQFEEYEISNFNLPVDTNYGIMDRKLLLRFLWVVIIECVFVSSGKQTAIVLYQIFKFEILI